MVQNLQPVGTVHWSDDVGDSWVLSKAMNEEIGEPFIASVVYGESRVVRPKEDGDWIFLAELQDDGGVYERAENFVDESDEYFFVDIPGEDNRYLFTTADE